MIAEPADPPPAVSALQALETLRRAGAVLTASLAYDVTLRRVARLVVPDVADWCAVLVIGEDGSEHEISSEHPDPEVERTLRGIRKRRRVTGRGSESLDVLQSGKPILATDVSAVPGVDLDPQEREVLKRLAPRSYMIVPLMARGRTIGAVTLLSTTPGRHYTAQDLAFAETLGGRFALAIDNAQLYEAAGRWLGLLDTLFATAPVGLAFIDMQERFVRVNEALAAMNGVSVEDHLGRRIEEVLTAEGGPVVEAFRAVIAGGRPILEREISGRPSWAPDEVRHWVSSFTPVRGVSGDLLGVGVVVIDNTERRRLLEAERAARTRADFLARAGLLLDASLDYEETLGNVADIAVPEIADWCSIRIVDAERRLQPVATAHADPERLALAREYERRYPIDADDPGGGADVARTGVTQVVREITDEMLARAITDPERLALTRVLGVRSVIIAPLIARRRTFGTLTLASAESGRLFGDDDVVVG